jgi:hypothetical protein
MKSEHRHDLQTNELGKVADKVATSVGGFFEIHGNRIMVGFCVVSLIAAGLIYKFKLDRAHEAAAWRDLSKASRAEDYAGVWERNPGTIAARWARVHEGESRLEEGIQLLFTNVESGMNELKLAREALQRVIDEQATPPEIRERAVFSLGRCLESMSDGAEGDAVKSYQMLLREFPDSIYKKSAETRIAALNSGSGQEFYAWFAKYPRPKPAERRPRDRKADAADAGESEEMDAPATEAADEKPAAAADSKPADQEPLAAPTEESESKEPPAESPKSGGNEKPPAEQSSAPEGSAEKPPAEPKTP